MKCFNRYPDQPFCFWLGFLTTGTFMGLFESGVNAFFEALLRDETLFDSLPNVFVGDLFLYGIPAGIAAQVLGYLLRQVKPQSPLRWIWLALLVPVVTFPLTILQCSIGNWIQSGDAKEFGCGLADLSFALSIYLVGALVSGLIAIVLIGAWKFLQRKFHRTTLMGNFSPEISW